MKSVYQHIKSFVLTIGLFVISQQIFAQTLSDSEIKRNVSDISNPLQSIAKLEPHVFEYSNDKYKELRLPTGAQYGFTVENLQAVFPSLVKTENRSYLVGKNLSRQTTVKSIDFEGLIPILVASIQQLQNEVELLKAEVQALKNK